MKRLVEDSGRQVLQRALELAGSEERLCAALWISLEELHAYLQGPVPEGVLLAALDLLRDRSGNS